LVVRDIVAAGDGRVKRKARAHLVFHLRSQPLSLYGLDSLRSYGGAVAAVEPGKPP
jgi:hypothetical protein